MILLLWGLWFGGTIALFIFVVSLFRHDRPLAIQGAPILFITFERYQLILGATLLALSGAWIIAEKSRPKMLFLVALMAASTAAVVSSTVITPKIMELRRTNRVETQEFKTAHGRSMMVYSSEEVMLLIAGIVLAAEIGRGASGNRKLEGAETQPLQTQRAQ